VRRCPIKGSAVVEEIRQRAFRSPSDENLKEYLCTLPKFFNQESGGTYYIIEGDILQTEAQVKDYVRSVMAQRNPLADKSKLDGSELAVNVYDRKRDYYADVSRRTLRYAIDRCSFPDEAKFLKVRDNLRRAADDWQNLCDTCQIKFIDVTDPKVSPRPSPTVNFVVRHERLSGLVALAFFPHSLPQERYLYVDPRYFTTAFDSVGVLRHELGHILGYRHEQITDEHARKVPGCAEEEDSMWKLLTVYDPKSVMHYFCGDLGSLKLEFTSSDKIGHEKLYGMGRPASESPTPDGHPSARQFEYFSNKAVYRGGQLQ